MNEYQQQPHTHEESNAGQQTAQAKQDSALNGLIEEIQRRQSELRRLADQGDAPPEIAQALREAANRAPSEVLRDAVYRFVGDSATQRLESILSTGSGEKKAQAEKKPLFSGTIYRMETGKMIGGVCMGLADYLRIDPTLIRMAFFLVPLLFFFTPLIFAVPLLYLGMWIVLPPKESFTTN